MDYLCIYHGNCADGFGAALAVKRFCDVNQLNCEFMPAHFGDAIPDVTDKQVWVVDFSYPRELLLQMKAQAKSITVIDHHKTAQEDLQGLDFCVFDMEQSGAVLTWKTLLPQEPVPLLLAYIQDKDIWQWKLPSSKEVTAALQTLPMEFPSWEVYLDDKKVEDLIAMGASIVSYQTLQIQKITSGDLPMAEIAGFTVPCINLTQLHSDVGNVLCQGHAFAAMYMDLADKRVYSLRSSAEGVDVSDIAKKFGGGGHKHAAGFSVDKPAIDLSLQSER
ncbi:MAG: hypothetical protein HRU20_11975 [Pseudomonadales bacterium]|nr:hypothetical protein [Pseudomonadales bacterium]